MEVIAAQPIRGQAALRIPLAPSCSHKDAIHIHRSLHSLFSLPVGGSAAAPKVLLARHMHDLRRHHQARRTRKSSFSPRVGGPLLPSPGSPCIAPTASPSAPLHPTSLLSSGPSPQVPPCGFGPYEEMASRRMNPGIRCARAASVRVR